MADRRLSICIRLALYADLRMIWHRQVSGYCLLTQDRKFSVRPKALLAQAQADAEDTAEDTVVQLTVAQLDEERQSPNHTSPFTVAWCLLHAMEQRATHVGHVQRNEWAICGKNYNAREDQRMKILLIGGSGFVSGTLATVALAAGHTVAAVTRGQRPLGAGVTSLIADRRDRAAFAEAITAQRQSWDLVVDCIGYEVADAEQDVALFRELAKQLVFISTDFVYDPAHRRFPQGEASEHYLSDGYGGKKRQCEIALQQSDTGNMAWTVVRPCHIYGPGSLLGCLPMHGRDPDLITKLQRGEPLTLVGGGHFLQQPIYGADLARTILSCAGNANAYGQIYVTAGPEIIESRAFYQLIGEILGVTVQINELPVQQFLAENPDRHSFCCHRIYDMRKLRDHGLYVPDTPLAEGLRAHVESMVA